MMRTDKWPVRLWLRLFYRPRRILHRAFLSLGYNCELAFRYNRCNGFVESGLFQWGYSASLDQLVAALENLDGLFTGDVREPNPLYECANTGIRQHGKAPMGLWLGGVRPEDRQTMLNDRADLVARMAYLKRKFVSVLRNGGALVAYKIRTGECLDRTADEKIARLLAALDGLGARDYTFLLVCESVCRVKPVRVNDARVRVRYVRAFNPEDKVTDAHQGDGPGWIRIFMEFAPLAKKKNKHRFKFEKEA